MHAGARAAVAVQPSCDPCRVAPVLRGCLGADGFEHHMHALVTRGEMRLDAQAPAAGEPVVDIGRKGFGIQSSRSTQTAVRHSVLAFCAGEAIQLL